MAKKRDMEGKRLYNFELSGGNRTVRWILIGVLLVIGAVALTFGLLKALETPAGWQEVEVSSPYRNCSHEFTLLYDMGAGERSATEESKALQVLYKDACEKAWLLFYNEAGASEQNGLYALNQSPNVPVQVDNHLYTALKQLEQNGTRALYLAPVYAAYNTVFYGDDAQIALQNDPTTDTETRAYVERLIGFANDPEMIRLELHEDGQVTLQVAQDYLQFAKENEIAYFVDFGWLRNAFILDYMVQLLQEQGLTNGFISSVDGFVRNLDPRSTDYDFNLFDEGKRVAVMQYSGAASIVFLRSYPAGDTDYGRYYTFPDGRTLTALIDPKDGQCKAASKQLVSYSREMSCAELALSVMPVYITEQLDEQQLSALTQQGIYSLWFTEKQLRYNLQDLQIQLNDKGYTTQFVP